jgi:hypothetical protein
MEISMPVSRSVGSHGYGDVWHVVPRCNDDQVQNHNYEHYSTVLDLFGCVICSAHTVVVCRVS